VNFSFVDPWHLFLPHEGGHVIAFSGSGGKTSLMIALAAWYSQQGLPVLLTTTTRTEALADIPVVDSADSDGLAAMADVPLFFLRSSVDETGKWQGLTSEAVDSLGDEFPERVVLVEVDGAGKKPLKYYRDGEPVWPIRTSLALVVMGVNALGESIKDAVFRFDRSEFSPLAELSPDTFWTWEHYFCLLTAEGGYLDQVPAEVPVVLALAGMGELVDSIGLFEFMSRAMAHPRIPLAMFCETSGETPSLRAVCRREDDLDDSTPTDGAGAKET
jgi:probable selenium-dependent hydroxylase accessory protein YqeC